MHKVVVERPRWNPAPGKNGRRANLSDELLPKFEKIAIYRSKAREIYGRDAYCVGKRQLSRRELRRLGVFNTPVTMTEAFANTTSASESRD